jgi:hypothetical protein
MSIGGQVGRWSVQAVPLSPATPIKVIFAGTAATIWVDGRREAGDIFIAHSRDTRFGGNRLKTARPLHNSDLLEESDVGPGKSRKQRIVEGQSEETIAKQDEIDSSNVSGGGLQSGIAVVAEEVGEVAGEVVVGIVGGIIDSIFSD